jgi:hypothetical protein
MMGGTPMDLKSALWVVWLGAFHHPTAWLDAEAARAWRSLHDLQVPAVTLLLAPVGQHLATIGGIRPDLLQSRHEERQTSQQLACAHGVMDIGTGNIASDGEAQGINQEVAFAPLHAFVGIVPANASGLLDGLHTLAIHDGRAWFQVAADALALGPMQGSIQRMPGAFEAEASEVIEHRLPRRETRRKIVPGASGAQDVEDGVEDAAQRVHPGLPRRGIPGR